MRLLRSKSLKVTERQCFISSDNFCCKSEERLLFLLVNEFSYGSKNEVEMVLRCHSMEKEIPPPFLK
jgi:hypothetical protein